MGGLPGRRDAAIMGPQNLGNTWESGTKNNESHALPSSGPVQGGRALHLLAPPGASQVAPLPHRSPLFDLEHLHTKPVWLLCLCWSVKPPQQRDHLKQAPWSPGHSVPSAHCGGGGCYSARIPRLFDYFFFSWRRCFYPNRSRIEKAGPTSARSKWEIRALLRGPKVKTRKNLNCRPSDHRHRVRIHRAAHSACTLSCGFMPPPIQTPKHPLLCLGSPFDLTYQSSSCTHHVTGSVFLGNLRITLGL